jgi:hypothetical protein
MIAVVLSACDAKITNVLGVDEDDTASHNERPMVDTVDLSPAAPLTTEVIVATIASSDPDGDAVSLRLEWAVNGVANEESGMEIAAESTAKGQAWTLTVWAADGEGEGEPMTSAPVTIANSPPDAAVVTIQPLAPTEQLQNLRCVVDAVPDDIDGDAVDIALSWTVDGAPFNDAETADHPGDTVPAAFTVADQVWGCTATATDGEASVPSVLAVVTIQPAYAGWGDGPFNLGDADQVFLGVGEEDWVGIAVADAGDVDGDGLGDVLIGAEGVNAGGDLSGASYLFRASDLFTGEPIAMSDAAWAFDGNTAYDYAGHSLSGAGDVDGDGLDDVLLTAHNDDTVAYNAGAVSIFLSGELGEIGSHRSMDSAEHVLLGEGERSYVGFAVSRAGDVDGDGLGDVLLGAFGNRDRENYRGKAYLIRGTELTRGEALLSETGTMMWGEGQRDYAGWDVASAGDVDGDGWDDLIVGAPGQDDVGEDGGKAYLVLGASLSGVASFELADADLHLIGAAEGDWAGYSVAGPGDVNGDGVPDLWIGALESDAAAVDAGIGHLVTDLGAMDGTALSLADATVGLTGEAESDKTGRRVAAAGDVDGDTRGDLLIASTDADAEGFGDGCAYLVLAASLPESGVVSLADADAQFAGAVHFDEAGWGLSGGGDVDGDGLADILIGAPYHDSPVTEAGAAHLVLSR